MLGWDLGMGETVKARAEMLMSLTNIEIPPKSVPINQLMQVPGTLLHGAASVDPIDFVLSSVVTRILIPTSYVRLFAGRTKRPQEVQALCFFADVNSTFSGEPLLMIENPEINEGSLMFGKLGMASI